jgi:hypothetical protein
MACARPADSRRPEDAFPPASTAVAVHVLAATVDRVSVLIGVHENEDHLALGHDPVAG